jgi:predicted phage tail protein
MKYDAKGFAESRSLLFNDVQEYCMAKILEFKRVKRKVEKTYREMWLSDDLEADVDAIMNDFSLTPANRRWILESMLMDIDDRLQEYKRELQRAERKLNSMVKTAEKEIVAAYSDFEHSVRGMTQAVQKLTQSHRPRLEKAVSQVEAEQQGNPK